MARALIVGCGCRGRALGLALLDVGWQVRGTTRRTEAVATIETAGFEGVVADPDRVGTVLEHVADVAVVAYLMAGAEGRPEAVAAIHGERLERLLERLVDSPVRGFVYEDGPGAGLVSDASERWRIPARLIEADLGDHERWLAAATHAVTNVLTS